MIATNRQRDERCSDAAGGERERERRERERERDLGVVVPRVV